MILLDKVDEQPSKHHPHRSTAGDLERDGAPVRAPSPTVSFGSTGTYVTLPEYTESHARLVNPDDVPTRVRGKRRRGGCLCWPEKRDGRFWRAVGLAFAIYVVLTIIIAVPVYFVNRSKPSHEHNLFVVMTVTSIVYPSSEGASDTTTFGSGIVDETFTLTDSFSGTSTDTPIVTLTMPMPTVVTSFSFATGITNTPTDTPISVPIPTTVTSTTEVGIATSRAGAAATSTAFIQRRTYADDTWPKR